MKHQLAARRGRIDGFGDALESDSLGLQLAYQLDQVLERPPQPVEPLTGGQTLFFVSDRLEESLTPAELLTVRRQKTKNEA